MKLKPYEAEDRCEYCKKLIKYNKIDASIDLLGYNHIVCPYCNNVTKVKPYKE